MNIILTSLFISYLYNTVLVYNRNKSWTQGFIRYIIPFTLLFLGLLLFLYQDFLKLNNINFILGVLFSPTLLLLSLIIIRKHSFYLHKRDIYLWLKYSNEINDSTLSGGNHVKTSDRIYSIILLFFMLVSPIICAIIFDYIVKHF